MEPRSQTTVPSERRLRSRGPQDTARLASDLGARMRPVPPEGWVLALEGDLGAGKTVFVRGLARGLGLPSGVPVTSPTFTVAQRFDLPDGLELHHLDAFRLSGVEELEAAGWEDACGKGRVTCVEWAERVSDALPPDRLEVRLAPPPASRSDPQPLSADARDVTVTAWGPRATRLLAAWLPPSAEERG
jgi:tRNA threonylcarbamoyladenosine biosynthesis protein TsaE